LKQKYKFGKANLHLKKSILKSMKSKLVIIVFLLLVFIGNAQTKDSISSLKPKEKITYKQLIAPLP